MVKWFYKKGYLKEWWITHGISKLLWTISNCYVLSFSIKLQKVSIIEIEIMFKESWSELIIKQIVFKVLIFNLDFIMKTNFDGLCNYIKRSERREKPRSARLNGYTYIYKKLSVKIRLESGFILAKTISSNPGCRHIGHHFVLIKLV